MDVTTLRSLPNCIKHSEDTAKALEGFALSPTETAPEVVGSVIKEISMTGLLCYPWDSVRAAISYQLEILLKQFQPSVQGDISEDVLEQRKTSLVSGIHVFEEAPFTIQRICEILDNNGSGFCSVGKLLNALEKLIRVNTVQPKLSPRSFDTALVQAVGKMVEQKIHQNQEIESKKEIEEQKKQLEEADLMEID